MKILKWSGIVLAVLAAIYTLLIFVMPASRIEMSIVVDKPVEVAWRGFTDESRMGEWMTGFKSMETISGEKMTAGSRYRFVFEEDGEIIEFEEVMLTVIPNKEFSFHLTADFMESTVKLSFEPSGEGTRILVENEYRGRGLIAPLLPLFKSMMVERQEQDYGKLKAMIEAEG